MRRAGGERSEGGGEGGMDLLGLVSRLVDAQLEFCISASLQIIQMYVNICYIIIGSLLARKKLKANSSSVTIVFFHTVLILRVPAGTHEQLDQSKILEILINLTTN